MVISSFKEDNPFSRIIVHSRKFNYPFFQIAIPSLDLDKPFYCLIRGDEFWSLRTNCLLWKNELPIRGKKLLIHENGSIRYNDLPLIYFSKYTFPFWAFILQGFRIVSAVQSNLSGLLSNISFPFFLKSSVHTTDSRNILTTSTQNTFSFWEETYQILSMTNIHLHTKGYQNVCRLMQWNQYLLIYA